MKTPEHTTAEAWRGHQCNEEARIWPSTITSHKPPTF